jgi:ribosome-binding ATPase YchF (GTP1/OBG family)
VQGHPWDVHENWHYRPAAGGQDILFKILTKAKLEEKAYSNPREEHIGVARVPDERLDKLSALYSPKKTTYATVEYVDVAAIGQEALKETAFLTSLRNVDALIHVLRAFDDDRSPTSAPSIRCATSGTSSSTLMISDLTQIEKRLERLEKDLKKAAPASSSASTRCCCARKELSKKSSRCANSR